MRKPTKAQAKRDDLRIEEAYRTRCCGVQISVMDIGKVFREGHKAIAEGVTDEVLGDRIATFVETIRQ
jgi:hypothetical protein